MNIRIGNDIKVSVPLSKFGDINPKNIRMMSCTFIKKDEIEEYLDQHPLPIFHHSSQYTVHGCGIPMYNVLPSDHHRCLHHIGPHSCGHVVCMHNDFTTGCKIEGQNVTAVFPAEVQCEAGTYSCRFDLKVYEQGWDFDNIHSYRQEFEDIMKITSDNSGQSGSIVINPDGTNKVDTYVLSATDAELKALNGNYSSIIGNTEGFELAAVKDGIVDMNISGTKKHIVLLSKYNSLIVMYNTFQFPMKMYKLDNGYYLYVSVYTYSNYNIQLRIVDSKISNSINTDNPWVDDDTPTPSPTPDPTPDDIYVNYYLNDDITLYGNYLNSNISTSGNIINYNLGL